MEVFDRGLFAFTIASHIILVSMSLGLIVLMVFTEFLAIRRKDSHLKALLERLTKVFVISFGVGTASGIVMAVELVMLFPTFMTAVSLTGVIAIFYFEVFAFMLETVALIVYVYYADRFRSPYAHWAVSILVLAGVMLSAVFIVMVNAWMNTPNGFTSLTVGPNGGVAVTGVNPWAPFASASAFPEIAHVLPTVTLTGVMLVGSLLAASYLRARDAEERTTLIGGLKIAALLGIVLIVVAGASGANEVTTLLHDQPLKYAAVELDPNPGPNQPETLFGSLSGMTIVGGFGIPGLQSALLQMETGSAWAPGLSQYPAADWPPLWIHITFDIMVLGGLLIGLYFFLYFVSLVVLRRKPFQSRLFLYSWIPMSALTLVVMELGWVTDEVGRQPWIIYRTMSVSQAANYSSGLLVPGVSIIVFYLLLFPLTFYFFGRIFNGARGANARSGPDGESAAADPGVHA